MSMERSTSHPLTTFKITGSSQETKRIQRAVRKFAKDEKNILLVGDVGTGKKHVARTIHHLSNRQDKAFVVLNCSALGYTIDRIALLGEEQETGGGIKKKLGLLEKANGGVLFLDNLLETPAAFQVLLLQILQKLTFRREGGRQNVALDIRVISSAVQKLDTNAGEERFRKELYFLLNPLSIMIPTLKERVQDTPELLLFFLRSYCFKNQLEIPAVPAEIFGSMMEHEWKGNIRELKDCVEHLTMMSPPAELSIKYLPFEIKRHPLDSLDIKDLNTVVAEVETYMLNKALTKFTGNQVKAAKLLGIPEATLRFKIRKYSIPKHR